MSSSTAAAAAAVDDAATFLSSPRFCCFQNPFTFPHHTSSSSFCDRIRVAEAERKWWAAPVTALRRLREWSEIVAGPRWKTFIRRFNRRGARQGIPTGNFGYDPLSYSLNFDEGVAAMSNGDGEVEEEIGYYPDFMSRYGSVKSTATMMTGMGTANSVR
ncbi:hypothetical protein Droror1_Dr00012352 [Drosera rotundifolia]